MWAVCEVRGPHHPGRDAAQRPSQATLEHEALSLECLHIQGLSPNGVGQHCPYGSGLLLASSGSTTPTPLPQFVSRVGPFHDTRPSLPPRNHPEASVGAQSAGKVRGPIAPDHGLANFLGW